MRNISQKLLPLIFSLQFGRPLHLWKFKGKKSKTISSIKQTQLCSAIQPSSKHCCLTVSITISTNVCNLIGRSNPKFTASGFGFGRLLPLLPFSSLLMSLCFESTNLALSWFQHSYSMKRYHIEKSKKPNVFTKKLKFSTWYPNNPINTYRIYFNDFRWQIILSNCSLF